MVTISMETPQLMIFTSNRNGPDCFFIRHLVAEALIVDEGWEKISDCGPFSNKSGVRPQLSNWRSCLQSYRARDGDRGAQSLVLHIFGK